MTWLWRYEAADRTPVSPAEAPAATEPFTTRSDAESWLGENYRELLAAGVDRVALLSDGTEEYDMSLHPAEEG